MSDLHRGTIVAIADDGSRCFVRPDSDVTGHTRDVLVTRGRVVGRQPMRLGARIEFQLYVARARVLPDAPLEVQP
jgi:hypothetical protein